MSEETKPHDTDASITRLGLAAFCVVDDLRNQLPKETERCDTPGKSVEDTPIGALSETIGKVSNLFSTSQERQT